MLDVKDLGPIQHFLGVSFQREADGAYLSQQGSIAEILLRFGMKDCKPVYTPMVSKSLDEAKYEEANQTHYQKIIGCLLYLAGRIRPDICATVNILSRYAASLRLSRLVAAKRVLRYLQGTKTLCRRIQRRGSNLTAYADADWESEKTTRKSTSGVLMQMGGSTVSWKTRKQSIIAV